MENIAELGLVRKTGKVTAQKEKSEDAVDGVNTEITHVQKEFEVKELKVKARNEGEEKVPIKAAAVLTERNAENNISIANTTNKMVSPVLLKLRRNQERRVTPANPVDPVQVPPKQFLGFPAERYMSPTDSIMSPISRGLLARSRRSKRLPPAFVPPKALDHTFQDAELANSSSS
eukprot:c22338_g1_i1 orf=187-711(+)